MAFDRWKDNHESSDEESEKENEAPIDPVATVGAAVVKTTSNSLKAETRLQSFIDTLTRLDQKLIKDQNA